MARTLVGLDIGSAGVHAAELVPGRRRSTLRRYASVPLAPGVVRAGVVIDGPALTEALVELWSLGNFGTKSVRLAVANSGVMVRQMTLDWMPPADFRQSLRYQVEDLLPMGVDDANLDYHLLDEFDLVQDGETRRMARILLVAAGREMVDGFLDATRRAGLRTTSVDLMAFALVRARTPGGLEGADAAEAIVDIGSDVVSIVVHTGGAPRYVRMIPGMGGDLITQAVQHTYQWSWDEAERTKISVGLPGHARFDESQRAAFSPRTDGLEHPAQRIVAEATDAVVAEIATTLDFYRASASDAAAAGGGEAPAGVARVLLAGSGALLGGLPERLAERLDLPVERLDARARVRSGHGVPGVPDDPAGLAVPAGLCVGAVR